MAVGQRKSAHLSDPTWRAASKAIGNQDYFDTLLEILLDCTTLIEYLDRLLQNESYPESFDLGRRLFYHCLVIEERFLTWYDASLQTALDGSVPWPNSSRVSPYLASVDLEKFEACFGDHLDFTSFKIAQAHLLYWTGLVLLYPVMSQLASFCGAEFITGECHEPWEKYTATKKQFTRQQRLYRSCRPPREPNLSIDRVLPPAQIQSHWAPVDPVADVGRPAGLSLTGPSA